MSIILFSIVHFVYKVEVPTEVFILCGILDLTNFGTGVLALKLKQKLFSKGAKNE